MYLPLVSCIFLDPGVESAIRILMRIIYLVVFLSWS